jgi:hypothetical protein
MTSSAAPTGSRAAIAIALAAYLTPYSRGRSGATPRPAGRRCRSSSTLDDPRYTLGAARGTGPRCAAGTWTGSRSTIGPLMYVELRWIIAGIGAPHRDALVQSRGKPRFPLHPSVTLAFAGTSPR